MSPASCSRTLYIKVSNALLLLETPLTLDPDQAPPPLRGLHFVAEQTEFTSSSTPPLPLVC